MQQRAEAELPVGAEASVPTSAKRTVPGRCASLHRRQVDGDLKDILSGSEVHLLVTTIWQVDGPKTLNSGSNDDFTSSDRR